MLLFPDRQPVLDFVNDVPTSVKRLTAMFCANADPDRAVADRKFAHSMDAFGIDYREAFECFR